MVINHRENGDVLHYVEVPEIGVQNFSGIYTVDSDNAYGDESFPQVSHRLLGLILVYNN